MTTYTPERDTTYGANGTYCVRDWHGMRILWGLSAFEADRQADALNTTSRTIQPVFHAPGYGCDAWCCRNTGGREYPGRVDPTTYHTSYTCPNCGGDAFAHELHANGCDGCLPDDERVRDMLTIRTHLRAAAGALIPGLALFATVTSTAGAQDMTACSLAGHTGEGFPAVTCADGTTYYADLDGDGRDATTNGRWIEISPEWIVPLA